MWVTRKALLSFNDGNLRTWANLSPRIRWRSGQSTGDGREKKGRVIKTSGDPCRPHGVQDQSTKPPIIARLERPTSVRRI